MSVLVRAAARLLWQQEAKQLSLGVVRGFAAAAPSRSDAPVLPVAPLRLSGTSASIATLVWQVAHKEKALEVVRDEIYQMLHVILEMPALRRLATDPFVPTIVRKSIIESVLKDSKAHAITKSLFSALAEENCLSASLQIAASYDELMLAHKKEVHCTIVTAERMDKMERDELKMQAQAFVEPGFSLVMKEKVDKKLLGGFVLEFEDRLVDKSDAKKKEEFAALVAKMEGDLA